jgi:outer membrane protein assembly factor BamB
VGDVDNDGDAEVAGATWQDAKLHLVDHLGNALPGFPKDVNPSGLAEPNPLGSVCLGDLDVDGDLEVFVTVGRYIFAWHHDGTEYIDGDSNPGTDGVFAITGSNFSYGTPSVANIDGEPFRELIAGMRDGKLYVFDHTGTAYPGFPFDAGGNITASPAIGDVDGDGEVEIVFGSSNTPVSWVWALRADQSQPPGFPVGIQLQDDVDSSPALGDLNGDGNPDICIGASNGQFFAINGTNGFLLPGFPVDILDAEGTKIAVRSSPVVADVDGDGSPDMTFGDQAGRLHCINTSGDPLPGFPIQTGNLIEGAPAVWDVDGDGLTEVLASSFDQKIYLWDTPWPFAESRAPWPMFKRNQRNTGVLDEDILEQVAVDDLPLDAGPILLQNFPNPFRGTTLIRYQIPQGDGQQPVRLRIFDLSGRVVRTMVETDQPEGVYETRWDGTDAFGRSVAGGIYHYRLDVGGRSMSARMVLLRQ